MSDVDSDSSSYQLDDVSSVCSASPRGNMSPSNPLLLTHDYRYCGGSHVSNTISSEQVPCSTMQVMVEDYQTKMVHNDHDELCDTLMLEDAQTMAEAQDPTPREWQKTKRQNKSSIVYRNHENSSKRPHELCWLCTFATHPKAIQISTFIVHNIANIDIHNMSSQIKDQILEMFPRALGVRKRDIIRHISDHMLSPNVRMAATIRSLMALADTLKTTMHQRESETGELVIDLKGL
jgi:hypothetical protein